MYIIKYILQKWGNILKGVDPQYSIEMISKIKYVTLDDISFLIIIYFQLIIQIYNVLEKYLLPLFESKNVMSWCVCPTNLVDKIKESFKGIGKNVIAYYSPKEIVKKKEIKKVFQSNTQQNNYLLYSTVIGILAVLSITIYHYHKK